MKNKRWLFGFRSGKPWKMLVAVLYYLCGGMVLFFGLFSAPIVEAGPYDTFVYQATVVVLFFWLESPAIFLSDTPIREKLPFFRHHTVPQSLVGMMCMCVFFTYLFATVDNYHTDDYKIRINEFLNGTYVVPKRERE